MENRLSFNVSMHEENMDGRKVFVADCIEFGISDFGESVDEAINNLKSAIRLLLEEAPEKMNLLKKDSPVFVTRIPL